MAESETEYSDAQSEPGAPAEDIASMVKSYMRTVEAAEKARIRVKQFKENILAWMIDNLEEGERRINLSDGTALMAVEREKKESTGKKVAAEKIARFFADNGLDEGLAERLIQKIYKERETIGVAQALSTRKKRAPRKKRRAEA